MDRDVIGGVTAAEFRDLVRKVDAIHRELRKMRDPANALANEWLDTNEALQVLRISRRTLANYLSTGLIACSRIKGKNYFSVAELRAFMEQRKVLANEPFKLPK